MKGERDLPYIKGHMSRNNKSGTFTVEIVDGQHANQKESTHNRLIYRHPPFFLAYISIFELVIFVYYALRSDEPISMTGPVPFKSKLIYNPYRRYEIWRFFTYMFIHAGYWHIAFNLIIQLLVGVPLEIVHGFNPIFIIYTGGVISGALANSVADPDTYLAGASSGCYALIAAHLSNLTINWREITNPCSKLTTLLIFIAADLGTAIYERHAKKESLAYLTSYSGHLAGFASGLLLGMIFLLNVRIHRWEQLVAKIAATIFLVLTVSEHSKTPMSFIYFN